MKGNADGYHYPVSTDHGVTITPCIDQKVSFNVNSQN